jgi:hypothetical protein
MTDLLHAQYIPGAIPTDTPPGIKRWLADELRRVSLAIRHSNHFDVTSTAPAKPQDGEIYYADGTGWDPGSGEGFYGREAGAWTKL